MSRPVDVAHVVSRAALDTNIDYNALIKLDRVHASLYTNPQVFEDEMQKIFYQGWVFVGHESEMPSAGDYICRMVGWEPIIMLRTKTGDVRVYSNRCTHRGNLIFNQEKGNAKVLTCNYHGWAFNLEGALIGMPYPKGFTKDRADFGLRSPAHTDSYGGFVFANFNPRGKSLKEHLGPAMKLIDRVNGLSPTGKINLNSGWVKQKFASNWKMLPENDTDGYHANFVHSSLLKVFRSQYDALKQSEEDRKSRVIDFGNGHIAIEPSFIYTRPFEWLGVEEERVADYVALMDQAYGQEETRRRVIEGPPHAYIFPNLFLGEMNVAIFMPTAPGHSVQWHTPLLLEGVPDSFNTRIIRQSEGAMGPSAFLLADDAVIAERTHIAAGGRSGWLELARGLERESPYGNGLISHISDETSNRGFWHHYRAVMTGKT